MHLDLSLMTFLSFPNLSLADEVIEAANTEVVTKELLTPASDKQENEILTEEEKSLSEEVVPVVNQLTYGETTNKEEANDDKEEEPTEEQKLAKAKEEDS